MRAFWIKMAEAGFSGKMKHEMAQGEEEREH